jgi:hypothetical protein
MAYLMPNIKTKKELKEKVKAGDLIRVFQPNNIFNTEFTPNQTGIVIEGPHGFHKFYCTVDLDAEGYVCKVK